MTEFIKKNIHKMLLGALICNQSLSRFCQWVLQQASTVSASTGLGSNGGYTLFDHQYSKHSGIFNAAY